MSGPITDTEYSPPVGPPSWGPALDLCLSVLHRVRDATPVGKRDALLLVIAQIEDLRR